MSRPHSVSACSSRLAGCAFLELLRYRVLQLTQADKITRLRAASLTIIKLQLKHITPEAARARIQTAIDQYRESQKKSAPDTKK